MNLCAAVAGPCAAVFYCPEGLSQDLEVLCPNGKYCLLSCKDDDKEYIDR